MDDTAKRDTDEDNVLTDNHPLDDTAQDHTELTEQIDTELTEATKPMDWGSVFRMNDIASKTFLLLKDDTSVMMGKNYVCEALHRLAEEITTGTIVSNIH